MSFTAVLHISSTTDGIGNLFFGPVTNKLIHGLVTNCQKLTNGVACVLSAVADQALRNRIL